jgi:hypothetical protein
MLKFQYTGWGPLTTVVSCPAFEMARIDPSTTNNGYFHFYFPGSLWNLDKNQCIDPNLKHYSDSLDSIIKADIKSGKCLLIVDNSNEGHLTFDNIRLRNLMLEMHKSLEIPPTKKLIVIDQNRNITTPSDNSENIFLKDQFSVFNYDYFVKKLINSLSSKNLVEECESNFPNFESFHCRKNSPYLSLLGTPRPHRIIIYNNLIKNGLSKLGLISFPGFKTQKGKNILRDVAVALANSPLRGISSLPIDNINIQEYITNLPESHLDTDHETDLNAIADQINYELFKKTHFSIVCETDFSDGNMLRITEKTVKSFAMGHPCVVIGNPESLDFAKKLGFDIFDDLIDASYDRIHDPAQRFVMAFAQIEKLIEKINSNPIEFSKQVYERARFNFIHARFALKSKYEELVEKPVFEKLSLLL